LKKSQLLELREELVKLKLQLLGMTDLKERSNLQQQIQAVEKEYKQNLLGKRGIMK